MQTIRLLLCLVVLSTPGVSRPSRVSAVGVPLEARGGMCRAMRGCHAPWPMSFSYTGTGAGNLITTASWLDALSLFSLCLKGNNTKHSCSTYYMSHFSSTLVNFLPSLHAHTDATKELTNHEWLRFMPRGEDVSSLL